MAATKPLVLLLQSGDGWQGLFDLYKALYTKIEEDFTIIQTKSLTTQHLAVAKAVIDFDGGLPQKKHKNIQIHLDHYVRTGGTLILACLFTSFVRPDDFEHLCQEMSLPWTYGDYHSSDISQHQTGHADITQRTDFVLNPAFAPVFGREAFQKLVQSYSMKAAHLINVPAAAKVYAPTDDSRTLSLVFAPEPVDTTQTPAVCHNHGRGHIAYIGDVNNESGSQALLVAMLRTAANAPPREDAVDEMTSLPALVSGCEVCGKDTPAKKCGRCKKMGSTDAPSHTSEDEDVQSISRSSQHGSISESQDESSIAGHGDMMLAGVLENYYRTRALEFLNSDPGTVGSYTEESPEVQRVSQQLSAQASQVLSSNGLVFPLAGSSSQAVRQQYLEGLHRLATADNSPEPVGDLAIRSSQLSLLPHPANDLQLAIPSPPVRIRSHYQSSFREVSLLGKGGFGKVYRCDSLLDEKTYAVKKILLSPKLGRSFCDGRHDDLQPILREVKAMARLDHPNVVRYHHTWFEEPQQTAGTMDESVNIIDQPTRQRLLLDNRPFNHNAKGDSSIGGIVFGEDTQQSSLGHDNAKELAISGQGWSGQDASEFDAEETTSSSESNIFTDGDFGLVAELAHTGVPASSDSGSQRPVGTTHYQPPTQRDHKDEKIDIFALGVVFVEMLCRCGTTMERVHMLEGLQRGSVPENMQETLRCEGYSAEVIERVVNLAKAMLDPDPDTRWSGLQVSEGIQALLRECETREVST
ncbi:Uu.00g095990.m01.CDS01 [Anthostomella pinea]|uniref:Uu.00g095990.m01.CDS01 n=1 Tax=Anthostomella pinea TaxID=933095 RepID=A0AAI8VC37_9PEZI|nr:Uu.00g095990.m01.CDS01 [Anthostomella pinea]